MSVITHTSDEHDGAFSFAKFARHPFFTAVNQWLVDRLPVHRGDAIVDLGCGPGAVTEMLVRKVERTAGEATIYAVDPSPSALEEARRRVRASFVRFVQGGAEHLANLVPRADAVIFCNAIHLVSDKVQALRQIGATLRADGALAFNTTFFDGAYPAGTGRLYTLWVLRAMRWLREQGYQITKGVKATAMQWLTPDGYVALLREAGFTDVEVELQTQALPAQSLEDISEFSMFIEGALPGIPLAIGAEALKIGAREATRELMMPTVPRYWLQVVAHRGA